VTTKDVIIQQLNDKLAAALEQEKAEVVQNLYVQPKEETREETDETKETD